MQTDIQAVKGVRSTDSRGRHTTTSRQLFVLPSGGFLIDTPGMRELAVVDGVTEEELVFENIETLTWQCQFSNCDHAKSQGCAVLAAIEKGDITQRQLNNYHKTKAERSVQTAKAATYKPKKKKQYQEYSDAQTTKRLNSEL